MISIDVLYSFISTEIANFCHTKMIREGLSKSIYVLLTHLCRWGLHTLLISNNIKKEKEKEKNGTEGRPM